jgi:uncharacterized protein DUF4388/transposase
MCAQTFSFCGVRPSVAGGIRGVAVGQNDFGQSWDDARKSALVAQIVSGKLSVKDACERHGLSPETIQNWVRVFRRTTLQALDDHLRQTFLIQGADAASLGSAEYTGTLADIPLNDLIQTFQMGSKDGVISVTCDGRRHRIWCRAGEIIDAESGRLRGESAAYRILALEQGQVFADFRGEPRERSIELPGNLILLEAARRKDEGARLIEKLGGREAVYMASPAAPCEPANAAERELVDACDGQRDLSALLEQSAQGDLETLGAAVALAERGAIVRQSALATRAPATLVVSKETPNVLVSGDILRSVVSLSPVAASQPPARRSRSAGPLALLGAPLALLGVALAIGAIVWGFTRARWKTAAEPASVAARPSSMPPSVRAPETYEIDTSVEPAHAELWLDGSNAGVGRLRRELLRDGQAHSLRVAAEGFAPTTLLFADAPPPGHIRLEPLRAPAREPARTESVAVPEPPASPPPPRARRPVAPPRAAERPRPADRTPPADAAPPSTPRVQVIEGTTPNVRIIE